MDKDAAAQGPAPPPWLEWAEDTDTSALDDDALTRSQTLPGRVLWKSLAVLTHLHGGDR